MANTNKPSQQWEKDEQGKQWTQPGGPQKGTGTDRDTDTSKNRGTQQGQPNKWSK